MCIGSRRTGTDIWAYGLAGPIHGTYSASLDNGTATNFEAHQNTVDFHHLLFEAHDLEDGILHTLVLTDTDDNERLAFDVAYVTTAVPDASVLDPTPTVADSLLINSDLRRL